jgi:hypothetical protein
MNAVYILLEKGYFRPLTGVGYVSTSDYERLKKAQDDAADEGTAVARKKPGTGDEDEEGRGASGGGAGRGSGARDDVSGILGEEPDLFPRCRDQAHQRHYDCFESCEWDAPCKAACQRKLDADLAACDRETIGSPDE